MAKQRRSKKGKVKANEKRFRMIASGVVILLVLISLSVYYKISVNNNNKNEESLNKYPPSYDEDSCRCVARERFTCLDGFKLNLERRLCVSTNGTYVTNVVLSCSEYECAGTLYKLNLETGTWEN